MDLFGSGEAPLDRLNDTARPANRTRHGPAVCNGPTGELTSFERARAALKPPASFRVVDDGTGEDQPPAEGGRAIWPDVLMSNSHGARDWWLGRGRRRQRSPRRRGRLRGRRRHHYHRAERQKKPHPEWDAPGGLMGGPSGRITRVGGFGRSRALRLLWARAPRPLVARRWPVRCTPSRRRTSFSPQLVIRSTLACVPKDAVGGVDPLHPSVVYVRIDVRMVLASQAPVGGLDHFWFSVWADLKYLVVVSGLGAAHMSERSRRSAASTLSRQERT